MFPPIILLFWSVQKFLSFHSKTFTVGVKNKAAIFCHSWGTKRLEEARVQRMTGRLTGGPPVLYFCSYYCLKLPKVTSIFRVLKLFNAATAAFLLGAWGWKHQSIWKSCVCFDTLRWPGIKGLSCGNLDFYRQLPNAFGPCRPSCQTRKENYSGGISATSKLRWKYWNVHLGFVWKKARDRCL